MKIAVAGTGYVGLSIATLLSQHHEVMAVDIVQEKVEKINKKISPIQDEYIEKYLKEKQLKVTELVFHKVWHISQFIYIFGRYWNLQFLPAFHRHILNMNFTYSGPGKHFLYIMTMRC